MKPRSKQENQARMDEDEMTCPFQQGPGTARIPWRFTRRRSNKVVRHQGKQIIKKELEDYYD